ncbi:MAG: tRNA (guanosine(37)-N1)-methyltransferase TrmD [Defluviitaleaceae bacterium]|nr:tRNA (guanosine(37)-N1)-methyltransferase TrmD [Defluviitaleaceae bacterium]
MKIHILTLFPELFETFFTTSIVGRVQREGKAAFHTVNFRNYSKNKHHKVDDYPYGGGQGMLLTPEPIFDAIAETSGEAESRIILLCPQGERFTQKKAEELANEQHLTFICGHYEGFDERIRQHLVTDELSLGDFVLTGGETAAMVMIDAIVRLLPGALPKASSHEEDSFSNGLLEFPQYTRPENFLGLKVPDVLLSGNHAKIATWRRTESLKRTLERRPDLLETAELSEQDLKILTQLKRSCKSN